MLRPRPPREASAGRVQLRCGPRRSRVRSTSRARPVDRMSEAIWFLKRCPLFEHLTPDGRETIFAFIEPGELFGELAVLDPAPRSEHAEAVEDSHALAIPREELLWLMARRPDVALSVTKLLGLRLRRIENRLKNL